MIVVGQQVKGKVIGRGRQPSSHDHSTESRFSGVLAGLSQTSSGASSAPSAELVTRLQRSLVCLGPSCWMMSGRRSLMVLVSGSPLTMKVLFWMEAQASGLLKWRMVLSSLKKLIQSTPRGWAPTFLTMFLTTLSLPAMVLLTTFTFLLWLPLPPVLASPTFSLSFWMFAWIYSCETSIVVIIKKQQNQFLLQLHPKLLPSLFFKVTPM